MLNGRKSYNSTDSLKISGQFQHSNIDNKIIVA